MGYQISKENMKLFYYSVTIIIVAVIIIGSSALFFSQKISLSKLENNLVVSRILFSEDCIASRDKSGEIMIQNLNEDQISKCTGLNENSKQGLRIRLYNSSILEKEVELNKALTSQCIIENLKNIRKEYTCDYSKNYVSYGNNKGILEIVVVNEVK